MELSDRSALVTGAAGGIGRSLSAELAASGCHLRLTDLDGDRLEALVDRLASEFDVSAAHLPVDLADPDAPERLGRWVRGRGPLDLLVNNAGGGRFGRFAAASSGEIERALLLNVRAPTLLARELLPALADRPEAMIVNVSSAIARLPYPGLAVYGAAKGYMSSLSESLACELADTGVRVLCFHPGFTETGFMEAAGMDMSRVPDWAVSSPEDVARALRRAIVEERSWAYSDSATRIGSWIGALLPHDLKANLFDGLFWELPP